MYCLVCILYLCIYHFVVLRSSWAVLKPEELKRILASWHKTLDEGKADDFIKSCEEHRMQIGSTMSIVGYKWTSENKYLACSFVNWLMDRYRFLLIVVYCKFRFYLKSFWWKNFEKCCPNVSCKASILEYQFGISSWQPIQLYFCGYILHFWDLLWLIT